MGCTNSVPKTKDEILEEMESDSIQGSELFRQGSTIDAESDIEVDSEVFFWDFNQIALDCDGEFCRVPTPSVSSCIEEICIEETDLSPTVESTISFDDIHLTPSVLELEDGFRKRSPRGGKADFSIFRRVYSRGVHADASKDELGELWDEYVTKKEKRIMGLVELKKLLFAYVIFCFEFCTQQINWHKSGDRRELYRTKEEQTISLGASKSIVECNRIKSILQDSKQSITFLKEIIGNASLQLSRSQFIRDANEYFHRVKAKLGMHAWANALDVAFNSIDLDLTPTMKWADSLQRDQGQLNNGISEGTLRVRIIGALGLKSHNGNVCNPYAILTVKNSSVPTVFRETNNDPEWSQAFKFVKFTFRKSNPKEHVRKEFGHLHIMNWDKETKKAFKIGSVSFELPNEYSEQAQDMELKLENTFGKEPSFIHFSYELKQRDHTVRDNAPFKIDSPRAFLGA